MKKWTTSSQATIYVEGSTTIPPEGSTQKVLWKWVGPNYRYRRDKT